MSFIETRKIGEEEMEKVNYIPLEACEDGVKYRDRDGFVYIFEGGIFYDTDNFPHRHYQDKKGMYVAYPVEKIT